MILPFPHHFSPDPIEMRISDPEMARELVQCHHPALLALLESRRARFATLTSASSSCEEVISRAEIAILLAFTRLALRHGSWGSDFHHYHNEFHVMEILDERTERLIHTAGLAAFSAREWLMLALFACCHDLHQRKPPFIFGGVGSNERASIEETFRILLHCGFDQTKDRDFFLALELMIAGTTFNDHPITPSIDTELENPSQAAGALAAYLDWVLDRYVAEWRKDGSIKRALELAQVAADMDTANVAETFSVFAKHGEDLCREREMRSQRKLSDPSSTPHVMAFLTDHQEQFFFKLHRFNSAIGQKTFGAGKEANTPKLHQLLKELRAIQSDSSFLSHNGEEILCRYKNLYKN